MEPAEGSEQDMLLVAAEIQRMLEAAGYKPLPITQINKSLSMQSHMILLKCAIGLVSFVEMHQNLFKMSEIDGCQMVSTNGLPWLGPGQAPAGAAGASCPMKSSKKHQQLPTCSGEVTSACANNNIGQGGLLRGKALEMMSELAETSALQDALRDIASQLLQAPRQTLLVSEVGSKIEQVTRSFLRTVKLRVVQLLQCFPNDFQLTGAGPATQATYRHMELKLKYVPQPSVTELNNGRYYRLLKLSADATDSFTNAKAIAAREVMGSKNTILYVDCRSEAERRVSMIPNAVPADQMWESSMAAPQMVVAYCCIGAQAAEWCNEQAEAIWGYKIRYLSGGIASWVHHGGPLVDAMGQQTTHVHCWVRELAHFFPVNTFGYEVVMPDNSESSMNVQLLANPSNMRHCRLRNLAWEVRLRYWPSVFCIEAEDLQAQLFNGNGGRYLMVDCRTGGERQVSTISAPGSAVIAAEELRQRALEFIQTYDKIVTFCTIGGRSGIFCKKLVDEILEVGYPADRADELRRKIINMLGGIAGWVHTGGGLVDGAGRPTHRLHPWCSAFMDMFPIQGLELVFDEFSPVPQDAVSLIACKSACGDATAVPQRLLQMCSMLPPEVIDDSLTQAMQNCGSYED